MPKASHGRDHGGGGGSASGGFRDAQDFDDVEIALRNQKRRAHQEAEEQRIKDAKNKITLSKSLDEWLKKDIP